MNKIFFVVTYLTFSGILFGQDLSSLAKLGENLPCFGVPKPTKISKNAKFSKLPIAIPKYYTSVICLIPGTAENILDFFKIPENISFLFDKKTFDPELKSANNNSLSNNLNPGIEQPLILGLTLPSSLTFGSAKDLVKDKIGKSEELNKLTNLFGGKKKKTIELPSKSNEESNKKSIFLNYKISSSGEDNFIQMKSEKRDNYINYFDLKISFKSSPNSEFQIVTFLLLSDLEVYNSDPANIAKKKNSTINDEVEIALTKNLFENIPKLLGEQVNIQNKVYGNTN